MIETITKLKFKHLPELRSLFSECKWLKSKFDLPSPTELQSNENKLIQFLSIVENLISQILSLDSDVKKANDIVYLKNLESKISSSIIPVKERLFGRLREANLMELIPVISESSTNLPVFTQEADLPQQACDHLRCDISKSMSSLTKKLNRCTSMANENRIKELVTQHSQSSLSTLTVPSLTAIDNFNLKPKHSVHPSRQKFEKYEKPKAAASPRSVSMSRNLSNFIIDSASEGYTSCSSMSTAHDLDILTFPSSRTKNVMEEVDSDSCARTDEPSVDRNTLSPDRSQRHDQNSSYDISFLRTLSAEDFNLCFNLLENDQSIASTYPTSGYINNYSQGWYDRNDTASFSTNAANIREAFSAGNNHVKDENDYLFGSDFINMSDECFQAQQQTFDDLFDAPITFLPTLPKPTVDADACSILPLDAISMKLSAQTSLMSSIDSCAVATAPSQISRQQKRKSDPLDASVSSSPTNSTAFNTPFITEIIPSNAVDQITFTDDEFRMSSKRRRRLNQIVPYPRKPRQADYNCSVCHEAYQKTAEENPWWAIYQHECPECHVIQVPRLDISLTSNAIEIDPNVVALYGEGIDDGEVEGFEGYAIYDSDEGEMDDDDTVAIDDNQVQQFPSEVDIKRDGFPFDAEGLLSCQEASKLLILMSHARTCSGIHKSIQHSSICRSTKFLMLHVRDCTGTDLNGRPCKFSWCHPSKKMLKHLTRCFNNDTCGICKPKSLSEPFCQLINLNSTRDSAIPVTTTNGRLVYASKLECRDELAWKLEAKKRDEIASGFGDSAVNPSTVLCTL